MLIDGITGRAGRWINRDWVAVFGVVVVLVVVDFGLAEFTMGLPRGGEALLRAITRLESNAGRSVLGAGVRPAKRFLSTTLSTVVLLAVTGSTVVVDRNRLGFSVGLVYRLLLVLLLTLSLLPLFVSFCWYRLLPPSSSDLGLKPFRAADGGMRADCDGLCCAAVDPRKPRVGDDVSSALPPNGRARLEVYDECRSRPPVSVDNGR